jgi:hypothetical protein
MSAAITQRTEEIFIVVPMQPSTAAFHIHGDPLDAAFVPGAQLYAIRSTRILTSRDFTDELKMALILPHSSVTQRRGRCS